MVLSSLTPEEDELLHLLEGGHPDDLDRLRVLVGILVERHWHKLIAYIGRRCFREDISAEKIASDTFIKAYEVLCQQLSQHLHAPTTDCPMLYSRARCPHFLGFVKALAKWKHLDEARKTIRYSMAIDKFARQDQQKAMQYGTLRSSKSGERVSLLEMPPPDDQSTELWNLVKKLSSREHLVIRLYYQYGPEALNQHGFAALATNAGLAPQEVRTLQKRFRKLVRGQQSKTICHLTQDNIGTIIDVDRETIRRLLLNGKKRLQSELGVDQSGA
jgi:RNA polymerase sigma factor (sigma-70 family)